MAVCLLCIALLPACQTTHSPMEINIGNPSPRLSNSTLNWGGSPGGRMISVAVSADGQRVYAGSGWGGMWRSDDGGSTWRQLMRPQPGDGESTCPDGFTPPCGIPVLMVSQI